jgi:hypothetical protein
VGDLEGVHLAALVGKGPEPVCGADQAESS